MNRNFIFVFILFATFSIINAVPHQLRKRGATFTKCTQHDDNPLTVTISLNPPVSGQPETFTVSGKLPKDITADKTILEITYENVSKPPKEDIHIQNFTQTYKAGDQFSITADIPGPSFPDPDYIIRVIVGDPTDDPKNPIAYGCALGFVIPSNAERG